MVLLRAPKNQQTIAWLDECGQSPGVRLCARCLVGLDELRELRQLRQTGTIHDAVTSRQIDRSEDGVGTLEIVVNDQVLVVTEVLELLVGLAEPAGDHLRSIRRA